MDKLWSFQKEMIHIEKVTESLQEMRVSLRDMQDKTLDNLRSSQKRMHDLEKVAESLDAKRRRTT